ncbi:LysR family transcriptional regulator, glycine cleavage system transcriptional activator [Ruegeria halocynthiae]|uniref:LysR family transcriptional regulator, glycine cleavage system transcriptional activator n=1 Tax=Ruegeria halocynthiae TaxID=985054 RepID=A0A1H3C6Q7_9RHOB|nr:LysR family transcriptional regulator [Ruegeria halocynthiae]SDX49847.1 LysR family transcriptional regulator, glycine cleavage system transcriptional activator [Ruegeria halocynthiae]
MDWLSLPPMAALRAFAAFAEKRNVIEAGAALNVSHAAISQQLRVLETHLGAALLDRSGKALTLTADGEHLARALLLGFGAMEAAVGDLARSGQDRPVHVSLTSSFAASWLMPRLPAFRKTHPEVNLILDPSAEVVDLRPGGIDIAIRYGPGGWASVQSEMLLQSPVVIVAAPKLLGGKSSLTPTELAQLPWLEEIGTTEATTWLAEHGVGPARGAGRTELPGNLVLDGLRAGQGVTVTVRHFVEQDIQAGRIVELYAEPDTRGYHIVTANTALRPAVKTFVSWLRRQARET